MALFVAAWAGSGGAILGGSAPTNAAHGLTTQASSGVDWLNVTVSDQFRFTVTTSPSGPAEISPGDIVHVDVTQIGTTPHTFTLSPTGDYSFPTSDSTSDLDTYFASHAPLISLNVSASTGAHAYGNFTAPSAGQYEYVCLEPDHFSYGMYGFLGSGEPGQGAGAAAYNGPGAPVFIIAGTITALVIIALVLGFVVGKRRGSHDEMPPERLGYPEPPTNPKP